MKKQKEEVEEGAEGLSSILSHLDIWTLFSTFPSSLSVLLRVWVSPVVCALLVSTADNVPTSVWRRLRNSRYFSAKVGLGSKVVLRCLSFWFFWEMTSGKCSWILRSCLTGDTRVHVSPGLLPNFTLLRRVDGLRYIFSTFLSFLAVTCSVAASPEEYRNLNCLADVFTEMFLFTALCLVRRWIHAHVPVYGGSWKNSNIFYVKVHSDASFLRSLVSGSHLLWFFPHLKSTRNFECSGRWLGISDVFCVQVDSDPAGVAVFIQRQVPAVLSGVQKIVEIPQAIGCRRPCDHAATSELPRIRLSTSS